MYQILIPAPVEKALQRMRNRAERERLISEIEELANNPRPNGCKKLKGYEDLYRVRKGDWRIIYQIRDKQLIIVIVEVDTRDNVYRNL